MQAMGDEQAAAKADARAATASAREAALSSEREKAFEALKQENERIASDARIAAIEALLEQLQAAV